MPKAHRKPHYLVEADIAENAKLAALPTDTARLGYFYAVLGRAKTQRPAGRFASRSLWREVSGRFARYLPQYLSVGLVEEAPALCPRCEKRDPKVPAGAIVVHDWHEHQADPGAANRAEAWRRDHEDGPEPDPDWDGIERREPRDQTGIERRSNADRTPIEPRSNGFIRAHARNGTGTGTRTEDSEYQAHALSAHAPDEEGDPVFECRRWLARHSASIQDGDGFHRKLCQLVATDRGKSAPDVIAAFEVLWKRGGRTARQLVFGAEDVLFPTVAIGARPRNGAVPRMSKFGDYELTDDEAMA